MDSHTTSRRFAKAQFTLPYAFTNTGFLFNIDQDCVLNFGYSFPATSIWVKALFVTVIVAVSVISVANLQFGEFKPWTLFRAILRHYGLVLHQAMPWKFVPKRASMRVSLAVFLIGMIPLTAQYLCFMKTNSFFCLSIHPKTLEDLLLPVYFVGILRESQLAKRLKSSPTLLEKKIYSKLDSTKGLLDSRNFTIHNILKDIGTDKRILISDEDTVIRYLTDFCYDKATDFEVVLRDHNINLQFSKVDYLTTPIALLLNKRTQRSVLELFNRRVSSYAAAGIRNKVENERLRILQRCLGPQFLKHTTTFRHSKDRQSIKSIHIFDILFIFQLLFYNLALLLIYAVVRLACAFKK